MRYGIEGFMTENVIDLAAESDAAVKGLRTTPSSALGSCRYKLKDPDLPKVFNMLKKYNIRYIFLIGGNDTMDTIHRISDYAKKNNFDVIGVGVPKTVDNDLFGTDHTPGFASSAKFMALSVMQAGILARDMQKVDQFVIFQTIGREAGWLAAASALGKKSPDDAPHILCLPERKFEQQEFLDVRRQAVDHFFGQVVEDETVATAEGLDKARGVGAALQGKCRHLQADDPAFGASFQSLDVFHGKVQVHGLV
jgi:6-phosphofructokinase 1